MCVCVCARVRTSACVCVCLPLFVCLSVSLICWYCELVSFFVFLYVKKKKDFDGKSVLSIMFCNVIMVSLLYLHVCVQGRLARTGWKIRPWLKTVIL